MCRCLGGLLQGEEVMICTANAMTSITAKMHCVLYILLGNANAWFWVRHAKSACQARHHLPAEISNALCHRE